MERLAPEQSDSLDDVLEPAENAALIGHHQIRSNLATAYRSGKLPHALLFVGTKGVGKATFAFHLAHHLLRHPKSETATETILSPDPQSGLFRQVASGAHPGVLHLTRPFDEKRKVFKSVLTVDEIRRINRFLSMTSHDGGFRIVIIDPADDMNVSAANALLKNLEEPPSRTLFVLIANSLGTILPTIRSRCQVVRFSPLEPDEIGRVLAQSGLAVADDEGAAAALADRARGSARRAILLTQYGGIDIAEALDALAKAAKVSAVEAHKLADVVAGRDRAIQYELFNERSLELLSHEAHAHAENGDLLKAKRFSDAWSELRIAIEEADTYNLDRKQHALNMIFRLNDTFRM